MRINALYVIIKLVERCNLKCTYCYYYSEENADVYERASLMGVETLDQLISYIDGALNQAPVSRVVFGLHGGEPTLAKADKVSAFCREARRRLEERVEISFAVQTNGVSLSKEWLKLVSEERMGVGISIDGDKSVHDRHRVDHRGRGSYERVRATVSELLPLDLDGSIELTALAVMGPFFAGVDTYRHMTEDLGLRRIKLLFADRTRDMIPAGDELLDFGRMLCEMFDYWLLNHSNHVRVTLFESAVRGILAARHGKRGDRSRITLGFALLSDGRIRVSDDFMVATEWFWGQRNLSISSSQFDDFLGQPHVQQLVQASVEPPSGCRSCPHVESCAGGEVAHRFNRSQGFDNPSVYCSALKMFHDHVDIRLDSGVAEIAGRSAREAQEATA